MYDLYRVSHGVDPAPLFAVSFGASIFLGPLSGMLGDRFGRRRCCLLYCCTYGSACLLVHVRYYPGLLLGRLLSAFSQEVLFTSFESYLVVSFNKEGLPSECLENILVWMCLGNFLIAIIVGVLAQALADSIDPFCVGDLILLGGYTSPFSVAILCSFAGAFLVFQWDDDLAQGSALSSSRVVLHAPVGRAQDWEHESHQPVWQSPLQRPSFSSAAELHTTLSQACKERKVLLCGATVVGLESSLLILVFMWTKTLDAGGAFHSHGYVFACFMMSSVIGSALGSSLGHWRAEQVACLAAVGVAVGWFIICGAVNLDLGSGVLVPVAFFAFNAIEVFFGFYFPAISLVKSTSVPEECRSTIYTLYRLPVNILACATVLFSSTRIASIVSVAMACMGVAAISLLTVTPPAAASKASCELAVQGTVAR